MGRYKLRQVDRTLDEKESTPDGDVDGWRSRVKAIVDANINKRVNGQVASLRTREHNRNVIKCAFETWHNKLNHKVKVPQNLTDRHIQVLVQYWFEQGKAASTMKGDLSVLRKFFGWMGKKGVVRPLEEYLPGAPAERVKVFNLKKKGNKSKSWSANGIDVEAKLQEAFALDERFGIIVAMQLAFGFRRKETICIRPWVNDLREIGENSFFMHERDGTKGGKKRHIKIQFAFQVWILDYAKARTAKRATLGWPRTRRGEIAELKQNLERYKYYMKKLGITRAEVNATGHGARAEYSENCLMLEGFVPATLGGKANQMSRDDLRIRSIRVSENLGHHRERVTRDSYYGAPDEDDATPTDVSPDSGSTSSDGKTPAAELPAGLHENETGSPVATGNQLEKALAAAGEAPKDFFGITGSYYRTMPSRRQRPDPSKPPVPGIGRFAFAKPANEKLKGGASKRDGRPRQFDDRQLRLPLRDMFPTIARVSRGKNPQTGD